MKEICLTDYTQPDSVSGEDRLHNKSRDSAGPWAPNDASKVLPNAREPLSEDEAFKQMMMFFEDYYADEQYSNPILKKDIRIAEAQVSIKDTGDYQHTTDELTWAAKTAWRNAARCIGRDLWKTLVVVDERAALTCREIFDAICDNVRIAFNGGKIISTATIFRQRFRKDRLTPGIRVWNGVLMGFAGFELENGDVIGDPKNIPFTNIAVGMGWKPCCTNFELLPLIITDAYHKTQLFELPEDIKGYTVDIVHPERPEITKMGLKWYSIPLVSSLMLEAGGIQYTCSQIAAFFQDTEISVMNLLGPPRYNLMEPIGRLLKLDVSRNSTYWKCVVATEVTKAVYHSFTVARVSIIDHMTMADNFCSFMKEELKTRGGCPSDWIWLVPPMSSGIVPTFYTEMLRYSLSPSFEYQIEPELFFRPTRKHVTFKTLVRSTMLLLCLMRGQRKERRQINLIYATEGGTAHSYAKIAESLFEKAFSVTTRPINEITCQHDFKKCMETSDVTVFVVSCFGEGDAPAMGKIFQKNITEGLYSLDGTSFAVFGLGSSQYIETFAMFGKLLDAGLEKIGGKRLNDPGFGDDQLNQKLAFEVWINEIFRKCCNMFIQCSSYIFRSQYRWRYSDEKSLYKSIQEKVGLSKQMIEFTLVRRDNLSSNGTPGKYFIIVLSYHCQMQTSFSPGQCIGIFPKNPPKVKDALLNSLENVPFSDIPLKLEKKKSLHGLWEETDLYQSGLNLEQILINIVDLSYISHNMNLRKGSDTKFQAVLTINGQNNSPQSPKLDCAKFIGYSPTINRRLFSIASCPNHQNTVKILVALHEFEDNGQIKQGLATNFLRHAPLGEVIYGYFSTSEKAQLLLPKEHHVPLILISAGSGFAPFMSFIESRELVARSGIKTGHIYIFHGCRFKEWDFLDKLLEKACRVLKITAFRAYSRPKSADDFSTLKFEEHFDTNMELIKKGYVQDLLGEKSKLLSQVAGREKGHVYVCGATRAVNGVREVMKRALEVEGGVTLDELVKSMRYQEDKFG